MQDYRQWFVSGYHGVGFNKSIPWNTNPNSDDFYPDMKRVMIRTGEKIDLPDAKLLRAYLKRKRDDGERHPVYSFGFKVFDAQKLLDVLESLPGAVGFTKRSIHGVLLLESEDGVGFVYPLWILNGEACPPLTVLEEC